MTNQIRKKLTTIEVKGAQLSLFYCHNGGYLVYCEEGEKQTWVNTIPISRRKADELFDKEIKRLKAKDDQGEKSSLRDV